MRRVAPAGARSVGRGCTTKLAAERNTWFGSFSSRRRSQVFHSGLGQDNDWPGGGGWIVFLDAPRVAVVIDEVKRSMNVGDPYCISIRNTVGQPSEREFGGASRAIRD